MNGKILMGGLLAFTAVFGAGLWYNINYAYYQKLTDVSEVAVFHQVFPVSNYRGIDTDTSPLKMRACFTVALGQASFDASPLDANPLIAPAWFTCFDAAQITDDIAAGTATVVLADKNTPYGFNRYIAHYGDGRAYMWRQINSCGAAKFSGDDLPAGCEERQAVLIPTIAEPLASTRPEPNPTPPVTRSIKPANPGLELREITEAIRLVPLIGDGPEEISTGPVKIKADNTAPLSLHGCFDMPQSFGLLTETFETAEPAIPANVSGGMACFDAEQLAEDLQIGHAIAFWGEREIIPGVDRVVAVYDDGRAFVWHQKTQENAE